MAPRKKATEQDAQQGILRLLNKPIYFIDWRDNASKPGILRSVDAFGWVGIEANDKLVYIPQSKLDAIMEIKEPNPTEKND